MQRNTKTLASKPGATITERFSSLQPPTLSSTFKFKNVGDSVFARLSERRLNVQGGKMVEPSNILDVDILKSSVDDDEGPTGPHSIFESTGITMLMDRAALQQDDVFYLRFASVNKAARNMKEFAFRKLSDEEKTELENDIDDIDV